MRLPAPLAAGRVPATVAVCVSVDLMTTTGFSAPRNAPLYACTRAKESHFPATQR